MLSSSVKLLLLMLRQGACSRADLAKTMHLSRPAVSALVDGLIRQRILRESGCGVSNGGKPPIILTLEPQRFSSIGIDIGHESLLRGTLCSSPAKFHTTTPVTASFPARQNSQKSSRNPPTLQSPESESPSQDRSITLPTKWFIVRISR